MAISQGLEAKSLDKPEESRPFVSHGRMDIVQIGDTTVGRGVFESGWRWSDSVKPIAGTDSCMANHTIYVLSGRMGIKMDDGSELEIGPGDAVIIPAGHDAWTIGDEACVAVDWTGVARYAKPS